MFNDPTEFCLRCFTPFENPEFPLCFRCQKNPSCFKRLYTLFEPSSEVEKFISLQTNFSHYFLIQTSAALIGLQYINLKLPYPDYIVAFHSSTFQKITSGSSYSEQLAKEVAKILHRPYLNLLSRNAFKNEYYIKNRDMAEDKIVLLIKDRSNEELFRACETLTEAYPSMIVGITLI